MAERDATPEPRPRDRTWGVALVLGLALGLVYLLTLQEHPYGDGPLLVGMARQGTWPINKLLYPWLFELVHRGLDLVADVDPETSLLVLSAVCTAAAVALVHVAARAAGLGTAASAAAAVLLGLSPTAWFFATTVEVHAPNLAAGAAATLWVVGAARGGVLGRSALPPTLCLLALVGTHPVGAFWGPALAAPLAWRLVRRRVPRGIVVSALLLAASAWALQQTAGRGLYENYGMERLSFAWRGGQVWRTLCLGAALLVPVGLAGLAVGLRRYRDPLVAAMAGLLLLAFLGALPAYPVEERGAFYAPLLAPLALGAAVLFDALPRRGWWLAAACVAAQGFVAHRSIHDFQHRFAEPAWLEALEREAGGRVVVLTATKDESGGFQHFRSDETALALPMPVLVTAGEEWLSPAGLAGQVRARGMRLVLLRSARELEDEAVAAYLRALEELLGAPEPGAHAAYALFPEGSADGG